MDNTTLMEIVKQVFDKELREELHNLKKEIIISNSRVDLLETKLIIAYDELARTKEDVTRIVSYS